MSGAATESEAAAANASPRKDLAVRRTKIANEGMLITCVRTVPSMIDLGFAIYKSKLQRSKITDRDPKNVVLMLDGPSLMAASVQSSRSSTIGSPASPSGGLVNLVLLIGILIAGSGVLVFTSIVLHVALFR